MLFIFRRVGADPVAELAAPAVWFAFVAFDAAGSERGVLAIFFDLSERGDAAMRTHLQVVQPVFDLFPQARRLRVGIFRELICAEIDLEGLV